MPRSIWHKPNSTRSLRPPGKQEGGQTEAVDVVLAMPSAGARGRGVTLDSPHARVKDAVAMVGVMAMAEDVVKVVAPASTVTEKLRKKTPRRLP